MTPLGQRLRQLREARGLGVRELARRADVPHETITRVERGTQAAPSLYVAMCLARTLGVTLDYLAGMYDHAGRIAGLGPEMYIPSQRRE